MNTEVKKMNSIGKCLKSAREKMHLTQKEVAKLLCLKISVINEIENDDIKEKISKIFLKGYIYSYAKLVKIEDKKIKELINNNKEYFQYKLPNMKSYSKIDQTKKKYNKIIFFLTWSILLVIFLIIFFYYQYYVSFQKKINNNSMNFIDSNIIKNISTKNINNTLIIK